MLGSIVLLALSLQGNKLEILADDQHVTTQVPHATGFKPLTIQQVTSPVVGIPPSLLQEIQIDDTLKQLHVSGTVAGHWVLNAKRQVVKINKRNFKGMLELLDGGGDVFTDKSSIEMRAVKGPIPSSLCVRFLQELGGLTRLLVIYQVSAVEGLGPKPHVFVGETNTTPEGIGTVHPLRSGGYAAIYEPNVFLVADLSMKTKSGAIKLSQVDVYNIVQK